MCIRDSRRGGVPVPRCVRARVRDVGDLRSASVLRCHRVHRRLLGIVAAALPVQARGPAPRRAQDPADRAGVGRGPRRGPRRVVAHGQRARRARRAQPGRPVGIRVAPRLAHLARDAAEVPRRVGEAMIDKPGDKPGDKATRAHKDVGAEQDEQKRREFMHAMLADLRALDRMLRDGMLETGPRRIGAEQEMFLIDRNWAPARASLQMLEKLADSHYTTELGLFQLEANADPQLFSGNGLSRMEAQLDELVAKARVAAAELGLAPVLMGILPTLRKADLGLDGMVPSPRYRALNQAMADPVSYTHLTLP